MVKRIFLFLAINFLVVITLSFLLNLFHIRPYLDAYGIDYSSLLIFCLIWGMGGAFISLALSRKMAKWMIGLEIIHEENKDPELKALFACVKELAENAGLPATPEVGIYRSNEPNAFATGPTKKRSLVAISTGLLKRMNPQELKAVLGHEISHISNGDMVTMTLLQGIINAFVMFLARILAYALSSLGRNRNESPSYISYSLFVFFFEMVFMLLGSMVVAFYSRRREFRADSGGARLAGREAMVASLQRLMSFQTLKDPIAREVPALNAFKISHPSKRGFFALFATHPPLEERIERLQRGNEW